ncbi:unnamed protein product [Knipowitschia caucasica]|uniref:Uncharacterized protein n=1 Tax=Knipowitschia caucasica TaxID=637954 RepID=A0AAV2LS74_KNICA
MKSIINALKKEVPFRDVPAYSSRRRSPVVVSQGPSSRSSVVLSQGSSLSAPRVLLRSHSDTSLTAGAPSSPEPRCLSPQPPMPSPNGHVVVRTMGGGVRSRSPSLSRVGEGRGRHRQPR